MKLSFLRHYCLLLAGCTLLAACQLSPSHDSRYERHAWERLASGCQGEQCPLVNIDILLFVDQPKLNTLIEHDLLEMTLSRPGGVLPASLLAYETSFLANAGPHWSSYLQAKVREQYGPVLILELSSYLYTGRSHGMPGRRFINFDLQLGKKLTLQDMLLPGQQAAFWQLVEQAHQHWLVEERLDQDAEYRKKWPFEQTPNIALTTDMLLLKYDVCSIAPCSSGHPELKISYPRLRGVLKPQYFPPRG